jgi:predicted RNA-binding Zn-ribbon protein involved in translation (DUF1610 family)
METEEKEGGGRVDASSQESIVRPLNKNISECPECGGSLRFGSRDLSEGDYYWCSVCGYGPIRYPLFSGPPFKEITSVKELLGIIDADKANEALRIVESLKTRPKRPVIIAEEPVSGYNPPSPHAFLDEAIAKINQEQAIIRKVVRP